MPRIDWNSLDSFAGGLAGSLRQNRQERFTRDRYAKADEQTALENAANQQRLGMAQRDQAIQEDQYKRQLDHEKAAQRAIMQASQPIETRGQIDYTGVAPQDMAAIERYREEGDYRSGVVHGIGADLETGVLDDVAPDGETKIPNPERQKQAQADLELLKQNPPFQVVREIEARRAHEKAMLIGQRQQATYRKLTLGKYQAQMQDAYAKGVDTSELALLWHTVEASEDPARWMQDDNNQLNWNAALHGHTRVHTPWGVLEVAPSARDAVTQMSFNVAQMSEALKAADLALRESQKRRTDAQAAAEPTNAEAKRMQAEAELNRSRNTKPEQKPILYDQAAGIVDRALANDESYQDLKTQAEKDSYRDKRIEREMDRARIASGNAAMDKSVLGNRPGETPQSREADINAHPEKYGAITTQEQLDHFLKTGELPK